MLYHYTSIEKLESILKSQQFWFTKISDFDDVLEFEYTISMCCDELLLSIEDKSKLINEITKIYNLIFVGCFCSNFDSLFLWKNYGHFNIEFSKNELMNLVDGQQRSYGHIFANSNFILCQYHRYHHEGIIKSALKQWGSECSYTIPVNCLAHLATIFKNQKFCTEQETRLVLYLNDKQQVKTGINSKGIIQYFPLNFHINNKHQVIKSITIGPSICHESEERRLRSFLEKHNIRNITIRHSEISYDDFLYSKPLNKEICQNCEWFESED